MPALRPRRARLRQGKRCRVAESKAMQPRLACPGYCANCTMQALPMATTWRGDRSAAEVLAIR
eukprot:8693498-Heterocapsa_arctica.AAC.1